MSGGERRNADAAAEAGIDEATAHRRLKEPGFRAQVDEVRRELIARATARLSAASTDAVTTLTALLGEDAPPAVRLGAARSILDLGLKLREAEDLAERVAALEAQLAQEEGPKRWGR